MPSPEEQTGQDFGQDLFNALMVGEIGSLFDVSRREASQQGKGLRLKIRIQAPEMAALPWEFLYDHRQAEYLCLSRNTPTIRYLELPQPIPRLTVVPPLRLLGLIASPSDLPPLDVVREKQRIETALQDLQKRGIVELTWLPGQTWRHIMTAMRRGTWHIFHFIGHGGFDRCTDEGLIALADDQGRQQLLPASDLARLLADHYPLRLVLLNACEGARGSELDIYSSTAAILVRRGIAAVLAMQYAITDRAAVEFSRVFYEALADGLPVDTAATEARIAVNLAVENSLEWGTPVLFMRSPDGVLFDLAAISALPPHQPATVSAEVTVAPPPPEPPPPKIKPGHLWVETEPPDASVRILDQTEFSQGLELEPGRYEVEVSAAGYETKREKFELEAGKDQHIKIKLTKVKAHLWVETDPQVAIIKILDLEAEFVQGMELKPGRYEVEVSATGYETKKEQFELEAGKDQHIKIKLAKVKAHIWVETEPPDAAVRILDQTEFSQGMELKPGRYEVEVSADGYKTLRKEVELGAGEEKHLTIRLTALQPLPPLKPKPTAKIKATPEKALTNSIGMKFVLIPAGTFQMGAHQMSRTDLRMSGSTR